MWYSHSRRRVIHFNVTEHPTQFWTAHQTIEAFPEDSAPCYLLRDRDKIYGGHFQECVSGMDIEQILTAPQSPWQSPFVERLIGSIRRDCVDHVIVLGEQHLRRILTSYFAYYHRSRTHLSLDKDAPESRPVQPSKFSTVVQLQPAMNCIPSDLLNSSDGDLLRPSTLRVATSSNVVRRCWSR